MNPKLNCILTKILSIIGVLFSIAYTPFNILYCNMPFTTMSITSSLFISSIFGIIFYILLLKTNNPISRHNPFTINHRWTNSMEKSFDEDPNAFFKLDDPTKKDIRLKTIKKLFNEN